MAGRYDVLHKRLDSCTAPRMVADAFMQEEVPVDRGRIDLNSIQRGARQYSLHVHNHHSGLALRQLDCTSCCLEDKGVGLGTVASEIETFAWRVAPVAKSC